ncbi:hypothetical protein BDQ17DRAFT_1377492 [Cyathus striatus]|nr:hypothetical protein BDQ17DRAFT_1377492 [Cyathus striatus]
MSTALRTLSRSHNMLSSYRRALPSSFTGPHFYRIPITQLAALSSTSRKHNNDEQPSPHTPQPRSKILYMPMHMVRLCLIYIALGTCSGLLLNTLIDKLARSEWIKEYLNEWVKEYLNEWAKLYSKLISAKLILRRFILDEQPDNYTVAEMSRFFEAIHEFLNVITGKMKYNTDPTWEQLQKNWTRAGKAIVNSLVDMDTMQALALSEEEVNALESRMKAKVLIMCEIERLYVEFGSLPHGDLTPEARRAAVKILTQFLSKIVEVTNFDIDEEEEEKAPAWMM